MHIPETVLAELSRAECRGDLVVLSGQVDRALYLQIDKVLQAAGGRWNRQRQGHTFGDLSADEVIDSLTLTGEVVMQKDEFGFFETPSGIIQRMIRAAGPGRVACARVLEPSCGTGRIVLAAINAGAASVMAAEIQAQHVASAIAFTKEAAIDHGIEARFVCGNFLAMSPSPEGLGEDFDLVLMNPPFALRQDVQHVLHALGFLKPGGRLVAIMSAGVLFRMDKATQNLRDIVTAWGGSIDRLPEGSFKPAGTGVNTVLLTADRPAS